MAINFTVNRQGGVDRRAADNAVVVGDPGRPQADRHQFGCGTGLCGACMVHIDGRRAFRARPKCRRWRVSPVRRFEGLSADSSHPLQKAWLAEQVPHAATASRGKS